LTTDIYPADFNWTANWATPARGEDRLLAAAGEVNGIKNSGVYERTIQLDYDDAVAETSVRKLHDLARSDDPRPFALFASFTHPHDPFAIPRRYWDRYRHADIDMPALGAMARDALDAHSRRLFDHIGVAEAAMTEEEVRVARHAYYGAVSYVDDQVGRLLAALADSGFADDTVVVLLSDHGEALGERGLWFKRSFFDVALRIPLIVRRPGAAPARRTENVSLVNLFPTVLDLADPDHGLGQVETAYGGRSLKPLLEGGRLAGADRVIAEMSGEGLNAPAVAVIEGGHKFIHCPGDPPLLFERARDPLETANLAGRPEVAEVEARLAGFVAENWDFDALRETVLESQRRRRLIDRAHAVGATPSWDFDTDVPGRDQFFRACPENPSASNYNSDFQVRARPDAETPNVRVHP
ncbi:MAG: sulfatase-like hydrolase/transferase, partial [Magnetovibrio sp.]|nr:sulfatase-like hydrolase/transferase [Magnetovibrio sp.]